MSAESKKSEFEVPAAAEPFKPGAIMDSEGIADASTRVPGIDTSLESKPDDTTPDKVKPDKEVSISSDDTEEPEEEKKVLNCPACGFRIDEDGIPTVDDQEKRRWLRHVLGEERYTKTFDLFNGALVVTFRNRTTEENDSVFEQLSREIEDGTIPHAVGYSSPAYVSRLYRYMLASSLVSIETFGVDPDSPSQLKKYPVISEDTYPPVGDSDERMPIARAHASILGKMSEGKLTALLNAHRSFESLIGVLTTRSEDPDFWRPAGENS